VGPADPPSHGGPPGWRYEPADAGVGVLAEVGAFAPEPFTIDPDWYGEESAEHAERVLRDGYPATALSIVKATYVGEPGVVETMRAAYRALRSRLPRRARRRMARQLGRTALTRAAPSWLCRTVASGQ